MFGNKSEPSVIWSFGSREPVANLDRARQQLELAHKYKNELVRLELLRREKSNALVRSVSPNLAKLTADYNDAKREVDRAIEEVNLENKRMRRRTGTVEQRNNITALRQAKKAIYDNLKVAKELAYKSPSAKAGLEAINTEVHQKLLDTRAHSGLYWGNYNGVEQSMEGCGKGAPPRVTPYQGGGRLVAQLQKGMTWTEALSCSNSILQIMPGKGQQMTAKVRIGSDLRAPAFLEMPIIVHRTPPDDCKIKFVYVTCRKIGYHEKWKLHLVLSRATGWKKPDLATSGAIGLDVGWRLFPEGMRVAVGTGSDGVRHELMISRKDMSRWYKADSLQSISDCNFDAAREFLFNWIKQQLNPHPELVKRSQSLNQWKSHKRLAQLVIDWRDWDYPDGKPMLDIMEAWRKKDKHLYEWEVNQKRKAVAWRNNLYRNWAAKLSRLYKHAKIENVNWNELKKEPEPQEEKGRIRPTEPRQIAAVGELLRCVKERFFDTQEVKAAYTTRICHKCGTIVKFDQVSEITATCSACGATWDQDDNAAENIIAS